MNKFSFSTITDFDRHIASSIRGYADLHEMVCDIAEWFVEDNTTVYDIGCATGALITKMKSELADVKAKYAGIEPETNFIKQLSPDENTTWLQADATSLSYPNASLVTMLFTLQFIPPAKRESLLKTVYDGLNRNGALIIAEKIRARSALGQDVLTFAYYDFKSASFKYDEIFEKERSLRRILTPMTQTRNEELLSKAGFTIIEPFWQNYGFMGWLCVK